MSGKQKGRRRYHASEVQGRYLFEPGGMKHKSGAGDEADCLFFEESAGKFDLNEVK